MRQGVYPYEYIDDWLKFTETSLPLQRRYLQSLKYARYTDADYGHAKRFFLDFKIKTSGEYHDLYV